MAARAYWKGFLRLSLVSIAVEIYNAVESKSEISFRQIHKPSGRRINYTKTVQGVGEVKSSDIVKGYEVDSDTYVTLEPDEIEAVKLESKKTIDLVKFVDVEEIDPRYFERPYFIAPADKHSGEGYVVIREALKKTGKAGLAQLTIGGREWLVAITALGDGLLMEMLRYADELKEADQFFDEVPTGKPDKEMVDLAVELIERKAGKFTPEQFEDHYATALRELVQKKLKGHKIKAPHEEAAPGGAKVIDLMSALKKSIGEGSGGKTKTARATSRRAPAARRSGTKKRA
jgi:DNA end-binding protein Ku